MFAVTNRIIGRGKELFIVTTLFANQRGHSAGQEDNLNDWEFRYYCI